MEKMNKYVKYCPNVWVAGSEERYSKGDTIFVQNKYGKENEHIVHNCVGKSGILFLYSITRADGYNAQKRAEKKAKKLINASLNAEKKSREYYEKSKEGKDFLALAEPIKVGHHSEKRHRALIERNWNRMGKSVEFSNKANGYISRAEYWEAKKDEINLSMPESIEFYEYQLEEAKLLNEGLKNGTIKKEHSYSLTYSTKNVKDLTDKLKTAKILWE